MHAESHMYLLAIKSSLSLTGQNNNRNMSSNRLNLLTKNLEAQNPRRDTSILSVCTGLLLTVYRSYDLPALVT